MWALIVVITSLTGAAPAEVESAVGSWKVCDQLMHDINMIPPEEGVTIRATCEEIEG